MTKRTSLDALVAAIDAAYQPAAESQDAKGRTRARILRAATEQFQLMGYRRTSVDEVARAAGVAKGTVYVHFKNKAELLFQAIREEKRQFIGPFRELLAAKLEPAERLRRHLELSFLAAPRSPLGSKLMSGDREMLAFLEDLPEEARAQIQKVQTSGMNALLEGVGHVDELSTEERDARRAVLLGILFNAAALMEDRIRHGLSAEVYARQLAKTIVDGLGAR